MPLTIFDAEDAWTGGSLQFDEWQEKFEADWFAPLGRTMLATFMQSMPPEVKAELQARNPEAFDEVTRLISGRGGM